MGLAGNDVDGELCTEDGLECCGDVLGDKASAAAKSCFAVGESKGS